MNRMRHDDLIGLFTTVGHRIITAKPKVDEQSQELLISGEL